MTNILDAIVNIVNFPNINIQNQNLGRNRVNNVGEALEIFVKNAFANVLNIDDEEIKIEKYQQIFSWLGNQNYPPDIMIRDGDAIEVKKTQNASSGLALNSSYPKANIRSDGPMITAECRRCEDWVEKDLIYCVGHTDDESLKSLWMVYGNIYAAKHETYQVIKKKITDGIDEIPNVELAETNELGRVNRVDPLGITNLRIRGMWHIQNPRRVFDYIHRQTHNNFELVAIIPTIKYNSFPDISRNRIEAFSNARLSIQDKRVKDPNNPAVLIDVKLIIFS